MKTTNTTETMNEVNELSPAGYCLDVYLMNTAEIYERYTSKAINTLAKYGKSPRFNWAGRTADFLEQHCGGDIISNAIAKATRLVKQLDGLNPTAKDIEQVKQNYIGYIIECAKYEVNNA